MSGVNGLTMQVLKAGFRAAGSAVRAAPPRPGEFERMQASACTRMLGCHLVDGAGHWVQQEQPAKVSELLVRFLEETGSRAHRR